MDEQAVSGSDEGDNVQHDSGLVASLDVAKPQSQVMNVDISVMCFGTVTIRVERPRSKFCSTYCFDSS